MVRPGNQAKTHACIENATDVRRTKETGLPTRLDSDIGDIRCSSTKRPPNSISHHHGPEISTFVSYPPTLNRHVPDLMDAWRRGPEPSTRPQPEPCSTPPWFLRAVGTVPMTSLRLSRPPGRIWKTSSLHQFDDGASEKHLYQSIGKQT